MIHRQRIEQLKTKKRRVSELPETKSISYRIDQKTTDFKKAGNTIIGKAKTNYQTKLADIVKTTQHC
jgi:hypothetical protein